MKEVLNREDLKAAARRIAPFVRRTPVLTCSALDTLCETSFFFKCENFQESGSFKYRGATNAIRLLNDEISISGVAAHSSGNHAAALALAARLRDIPAYIVMPENTLAVKQAAVRAYGARITFCQPTMQARQDVLQRIILENGSKEIHPSDDLAVIAGQSTAAQELFEEVPDLHLVMTPVGGGGLLSGTALAAHYMSPETDVIAAEPQGADDAARSFRAGHIIPSVEPDTIADGLLTSLGTNTFSIISQYVRDIVTVNDDAIVTAMRLLWERMKIVIEPSSAVPLAAILRKSVDVKGKRVGIILTGGNCDLDHIPWIQRVSKGV